MNYYHYCHSGSGHGSSCSSGYAVANECSGGNFPYDSGTVCVNGWSANGRLCWMGTSVTGFNPGCVSGLSGISSRDCNDGPTANYCLDGNSNVGGFS